jgi:hypothetical protein
MSIVTLRVTALEPLDDHSLRLTFNDGLVRDVDFSPLMCGPLGEPLRDRDYFRQVRVDEPSSGPTDSTPTPTYSMGTSRQPVGRPPTLHIRPEAVAAASCSSSCGASPRRGRTRVERAAGR